MVKDGIIKVKVFGEDKNDKRDGRSVVQPENRVTVSIPESMIYPVFKPTVKRYIAKWFEEHKHDLDKSICQVVLSGGRIASMTEFSEFEIWFGETQNPIRTLINMLQFGYDIEKEKCYKIKLKSSGQYLLRNPDEETIFFGDTRIFSKLTKWQLEEAGFSWVFDCEGIEIEEVTE